MFGKSMRIPAAAEALPGRSTPMAVPEVHYVNGHRIVAPFPDGLELAMFGLGCFWGAERKFWQLKGVYSTAVGYAAGHTPNPDISRSLHRDDRPHGSGPGRLRSEDRLV